MVSRTDILDTLARHASELRGYGVRELGVFGSHARGDAREDSDIDLLVDLERKTFDDYMGVKQLLEDLFHRRIDLVLADRIKPRLRAKILSELVRVPGF
jgi:predicted nucleotidyltransferase